MHILYLAVNSDDKLMQTIFFPDFRRMSKSEILFYKLGELQRTKFFQFKIWEGLWETSWDLSRSGKWTGHKKLLTSDHEPLILRTQSSYQTLVSMSVLSRLSPLYLVIWHQTHTSWKWETFGVNLHRLKHRNNTVFMSFHQFTRSTKQLKFLL